MRSGLKILTIIGTVMAAALLIGLIKAGSGQRSDSRGVGGPLGMIVTFALFAAIRAIWKYKSNSDEESTDKDNHNLDKS